jgi:hypothetical protein
MGDSWWTTWNRSLPFLYILYIYHHSLTCTIALIRQHIITSSVFKLALDMSQGKEFSLYRKILKHDGPPPSVAGNRTNGKLFSHRAVNIQ